SPGERRLLVQIERLMKRSIPAENEMPEGRGGDRDRGGRGGRDRGGRDRGGRGGESRPQAASQPRTEDQPARQQQPRQQPRPQRGPEARKPEPRPAQKPVARGDRFDPNEPAPWERDLNVYNLPQAGGGEE